MGGAAAALVSRWPALRDVDTRLNHIVRRETNRGSRLGRRAGFEPDLVRDLVARFRPGGQPAPKSDLDDLIIRCAAFLAAYQNTAYADRYRALIAEQAGATAPEPAEAESETKTLPACPCCAGHMRIIEIFGRGRSPCTAAGLPLGFDTS